MRIVAGDLTLLGRVVQCSSSTKKADSEKSQPFFEPSLNLEQTDSQLREGLPLIGQNFGN